MANQIPDPRTLNNWEDAFQYPLPIVRKLEQQLRKNIDENRQKLRSLVGASYRDLLGTAEKIIEMDEQMQSVEGHLGDIGRKCNARAVERASENHARMRTVLAAKDRDRHWTMAQTKVLQSVLSVASRTIKAGGDALLVSKLLVLARLLHKSVSERADPPAILDELRRKFASLRKKLLSFVERALVKPSTERTKLAHTLCAYSLVSSSTPKDVLRHFLQARFEQLEANTETPSEASVLQMLDLYKETLLDARALFPKLFAEALSQLSNIPLLQDKQILSLHELNLDIYGTWISEDVRSFTPWVRHEQLVASEVTSGLTSWAKQAQDSVLAAVKDCIRLEGDAQLVLEMRKKVLSQYLNLSSTFRDGNHGPAINDLRDAFVERLEELAADTALFDTSSLDKVDQPSRHTIRQTSDFWDLALTEIGVDGGAVRFRREVVDRRHGKDVTIVVCVSKLDAWMHNLGVFWELMQQMRSTKWDEELDVDFDSLNDDVSIQDSLSKGDPQRLQTRFREATSGALHGIYKWVDQRAASKDQPALLIRLLREIDQRRVVIIDRFGVSKSDTYNSEKVAILHRRIAETVTEASIQSYTTSMSKISRSAVALWDGSPTLPVQPSPVTFRLLASLHRSMSDAGTDLWGPGAVGVLKVLLDEQLAKALAPLLLIDTEDKEAPLTNGHAAGGEDLSDGVDAADVSKQAAKSSRRHRLLQVLFDALYLQRTISSAQVPVGGQGLQRFVDSAKAQLELDDASNERLRRSANEYWRRTYLLFGLLAPGSI